MAKRARRVHRKEEARVGEGASIDPLAARSDTDSVSEVDDCSTPREARADGGWEQVQALAVPSSRLWKLTLRGVPGIHSAFLRSSHSARYDATGLPTYCNEWVLDATGADLHGAMVSDKRIDSTRCVSTDVQTTLQLLGVEAARAILIREIESVSAWGLSVSRRHVELFSDVMTREGRVELPRGRGWLVDEIPR